MRVSSRWIAVLALAGVLAVIGNTAEATTLPPVIDTPVVVAAGDTVGMPGDTRIGPTGALVCEDAAKIQAAPGAILRVYGTLQATNTTFESLSAPRKWGGIEFRSAASSASVLSNCVIRDAGGAGYRAAIVCVGNLTVFPKPTLNDCTISGSGGDGVRSIGGAPKLSNCTISGCTGSAVRNTLGGYVYFSRPCQAARNGSNTVTFDKEGHGLIFHQIWRPAGFPYRILGTVGTQRRGRITIRPGVELRMGAGAYLIADRGPITAQGSAATPIVIRGLGRWRGQWGGIFVKPGGVPSLFRHCKVTDGGAKTCCSGAAAHLAAIGASRRGGITIENCSFSRGAGPGIWLEDSLASIAGTQITNHLDMGVVMLGAGRLAIENSEIESNGRAGVYCGGTARVHLTPGNRFLANGQFDVVNMSANDVPAQRNYWGVSGQRQIARRIFDGRDSPGLGRVWFWPAAGVSTTTAAAATGLTIASATAVMANAGLVEVAYTLTADGEVEAEVLNIAGRPVRRIAARQEGVAGPNVMLWDRKNDAGVSVPAGRYVVRVRATSPTGEQAQAMAGLTIPPQ